MPQHWSSLAAYSIEQKAGVSFRSVLAPWMDTCDDMIILMLSGQLMNLATCRPGKPEAHRPADE